jgi:hypothetical protein
MTARNPYRREIPDYYDTMYEDGYEPWEILAAAHQKILAAVSKAAEQQPPQDDYTVNVTSEVKVKQ